MLSAVRFCTSAAKSRVHASRGWSLPARCLDQREARAPVLRVVFDQPAAQAREPFGLPVRIESASSRSNARYALSGATSTTFLPDRRRLTLVPLGETDVAEFR